MDYKEMLDKYRKGELNKEEESFIEGELEKYGAMEEYFSESIIEKYSEDKSYQVDNFLEEDIKVETRKLNKIIDKKIRKISFNLIIKILIIIILLLSMISFFLNKKYYNPNKESFNNISDIDLDFYALSEINLPGKKLNDAWIEKKGFGGYNIYYSHYDTFNGTSYSTEQLIKRNKIRKISNGKINFDNSSYFLNMRFYMPDDELLEKEKNSELEYISELNKQSYIRAEIMFTEDLTMDQLYKLQEEYEDIEFQWAGIRTIDNSDINKEDDFWLKNIAGINLFGAKTGPGFVNWDTKDINEKYPDFATNITTIYAWNYKKDGTSYESQVYSNKYLSLLKYLCDREEMLGVFEGFSGKTEFYKSAIDYAEKNGVKTYGVIFYGEAKDILKFSEYNNIKHLYVYEVLPSKKNAW